MSQELRMSAYYYCFDATGILAVDKILSEVAKAGKGCHHTDCWEEYGYIDAIQGAAKDAAAALSSQEARIKELEGALHRIHDAQSLQHASDIARQALSPEGERKCTCPKGIVDGPAISHCDIHGVICHE